MKLLKVTEKADGEGSKNVHRDFPHSAWQKPGWQLEVSFCYRTAATCTDKQEDEGEQFLNKSQKLK